ncbi:MAG TPA: hypothetical protein VFU15_05895 [Bacteroidia bacterium]|nr:hypothetical protein [Bacteroidia bacterium]
MKKYGTYLLLFTVFTAAVFVALYFWNANGPARWHVDNFAWIPGIIAAVSISIHFYLISSKKKRPAVFVRRFMAISTLRMIVYLAIIIGYIFRGGPSVAAFIIQFGFAYFCFMIFEVATLYQDMRKPVENE